jgi:hypothetical protein
MFWLNSVPDRSPTISGKWRGPIEFRQQPLKLGSPFPREPRLKKHEYNPKRLQINFARNSESSNDKSSRGFVFRAIRDPLTHQSNKMLHALREIF